MTVKDGNTRTASVMFFCSGTVALNRLVGNPTYPGIVDDYDDLRKVEGDESRRTARAAPGDV